MLNNSLGGNILSYNESEDAYYIQHGADSVPKKLGSDNSELKYIGTTNSTINVTNIIPDYKNKTADDFIAEPNTLNASFYANLGDMKIWVNQEKDASSNANAVFSKSYNANTGILTVSPSSITAKNSKSYGSCSVVYKIYCK